MRLIRRVSLFAGEVLVICCELMLIVCLAALGSIPCRMLYKFMMEIIDLFL